MGSRPSAPVTYRPTPTAATIYQSVVPEADYENLSNYIGELKAERKNLLMPMSLIPINAIKAKKTISNPNQRLVKKFEIPNIAIVKNGNC